MRLATVISLFAASTALGADWPSQRGERIITESHLADFYDRVTDVQAVCFRNFPTMKTPSSLSHNPQLAPAPSDWSKR